MMSANATNWSLRDVCRQVIEIDPSKIAASIYPLVCRTEFDAPGFCVLNLGQTVDSSGLRRLMVQLKEELAAIHEAQTGRHLIYYSMARFDQQTTTKLHVDGGPEENLLMLGYEPSDVESDMEISNYTKCAFELGLTPMEFMEKHNPMFHAGYEKLRPYTTRVPCFSKSDFQIVCINNSTAGYSQDEGRWQGTMHTATIPNPDDSKRRVINSTMIVSVDLQTADRVSKVEQEEFVATSLVRRRGYANPHLEDDV